MSQINYKKLTKKDASLISKIAERVRGGARYGFDQLALEMDLSAVHCNCVPLRLKELLIADDFNFYHDINGIQEHLDRDQIKLMDFFIPRFAYRE